MYVCGRDQPKAETLRFLQFRKAQKLNWNVSAFRWLSAERGVSAERLPFCRNTLFLQKCYCISAESFRLSVFLQKPTFLQKSTSFCRNQPLSAETNLFLQKDRSFCQFLLSAETFCFLYPLFLFRPTPFRLISSLWWWDEEYALFIATRVWNGSIGTFHNKCKRC